MEVDILTFMRCDSSGRSVLRLLGSCSHSVTVDPRSAMRFFKIK